MDLTLGGRSELQQRVITGVAGGAALLVLTLLGGRLGTAIVGVLLSAACLMELAPAFLKLPDRVEKRYVWIGCAWLVAFLSFWMPRSEYELLLVVFFGLFVYFLVTAQRHTQALTEHFQEFVGSVFALIYVGFLPLYLVLVRDGPLGAKWMCLLWLVVWGSDVGGYFGGKKWGRRKLYPTISPKKTLEGAAAGLGAAWIGALVLKLAWFSELSWGAWVFVPLLVGVSSQIGDLAESLYKRAYAQKDSGSILPGHGGVLDRFDGLLFALPVMYACVRIFG